MSFEVFFQSHNPDGGARMLPNPFKPGEMMRVASDAGLNKEERAAVLALLRSAGGIRSTDSDNYSFNFADGGLAEASADGLETGETCTSISASVWAMSPQVIDLLFELMRVGNLVAHPVVEDETTVVASEEMRKRLLTEYPDAIVTSSTEEFGRLLNQGFGAWKRYRDQVVGDGPE